MMSSSRCSGLLEGTDAFALDRALHTWGRSGLFDQIDRPAKNVGDGRWGGAITAAKFLEQFVDGRPWVHLDIAGPAFVENGRSWTTGGASGVMVRTLVQLARDLSSS